MNNNFVFVSEHGYPIDFRRDEIAIGYAKTINTKFDIEYLYIPIYFSDGDWHISGGDKCHGTSTSKLELIAYARVGICECKEGE